ncbi:MAG: response regulator [Chlorogloeopsis fritschii C42_A2020_084]|uniref:response regulator n=1 Tax=Chlorogloeopsis fritschii TaxID=1124 RepID=UPI001A00675D|nr:response regulator [Chlorogloeopsis fritschii]MBF2009475.1 response regulator [Chlorogloeopsis fritschii C42_A2020_084]
MTAKQILVIDDEDDIRKLIQTCLEIMGGWQVLTAKSGSEGLLLAQTAQPDAILLDVMMPDMDGTSTFQKLQANPATQQIPVILMTAKGRITEARKFTQLGVKGVISKPFNPQKLATQVAAALG